MSASRASVLIGFGDALAAPEVAASLLSAGYRVASFVRRGEPVALRRLRSVELIEVRSPEYDLDGSVADVAAASLRYDVTMPLNDPAVFVCDRAVASETLLAGPRGSQARLALDKRLQLRGAMDAGLAVPDWIELRPGDSLPAHWGLPVALKPALAVDTRAGRIRRLSPRPVSDRTEFDAAWEAWGEDTAVIAQRWVSGVGAGIFGLGDATGIHHVSAHRRVRMMNPSGSGSSACASVRPQEELLAPIERFLLAAGWRGMFMVELVRGRESWWFMELNGRAWGSLALSRRLGFEYPSWMVRRTLDPSATLPDPPPFRDMLCRNLGRELVHLSFVLRGPRSRGQRWPSRRATLRELLHHPRGTTWYNLDPALRRLFLYDAWRTVADQTWAKRR